MGYKKPILVEIFAELHLVDGSLDAARYFELVPLLKSAGLSEVELGHVEEITFQPGTVGRITTPRVRCWSLDRRKLVQLSPDLVVINQVEEYLGWATFEDLVDVTVGVLKKQLGTLNIASMSLNTIDVMNPPSDGFSLGRYLNCGGEFIPRWYQDLNVSADITLGRGVLRDDGSNRQIRVAVRAGSGSARIQMNCVFHDRVEPGESVKARLEQLHVESTRTFEGMITDSTRELMGQKST